MRRLYDYELSGNCYKIRLMFSLLGLPWERVPIDLRGGAHLRDSFLALNPLGKVPVLDDDGFVLRDSAAILVYLARRYGTTYNLYPHEATAMGEVQQWLSYSVNEMFNGLAVARAVLVFQRPYNLAAAQELASKALTVLEDHLNRNDWLVQAAPSIADIACYPYAALAEEGDISLQPYPAVRAWFRRIEALPGYIPMPGLYGHKKT